MYCTFFQSNQPGLASFDSDTNQTAPAPAPAPAPAASSASAPVLVNSQLTPALLLHMTYSNRLVWPQQWHTQARCADGLLLLHIYSADYLYAPAVVNCEVGSIAQMVPVLCSNLYPLVKLLLRIYQNFRVVPVQPSI